MCFNHPSDYPAIQSTRPLKYKQLECNWGEEKEPSGPWAGVANITMGCLAPSSRESNPHTSNNNKTPLNSFLKVIPESNISSYYFFIYLDIVKIKSNWNRVGELTFDKNTYFTLKLLNWFCIRVIINAVLMLLYSNTDTKLFHILSIFKSPQIVTDDYGIWANIYIFLQFCIRNCVGLIFFLSRTYIDA